jgi:NAD(P)-dependent dehydrogenase (short-subunit alcohol dehydrogenase family)
MRNQKLSKAKPCGSMTTPTFESCGGVPEAGVGRQPITSGLALVTGGTGAVCSEVAVGLALAGLDVAFACRPTKMVECAESTSTLWRSRSVHSNRTAYYEPVDMANASSVIGFVDQVLQRFGDKLRVLINCASVVPKSKQVTTDGQEMQFGVNVWGYYALLTGLMPALVRNAPSSVVNVASAAAKAARLNVKTLMDDLRLLPPRQYTAVEQYRATKAAEALLTWDAACLFAQSGVHINANHPGLTPADKSTLTSGLVTTSQKEAAGRARACCDPPSVYSRSTLMLALNATANGWNGVWASTQRGSTADVLSSTRPVNSRDLRGKLWQGLFNLDRQLRTKFTWPSDRLLGIWGPEQMSEDRRARFRSADAEM